MQNTTCQYRKCGKPLPANKRKNAKYCGAHCRRMEYAEQKADRIRARHEKNEKRFQTFHESHPEVFGSLKELAFKRLNEDRIGIKALFELTREDLRIRLDNTFTPYYSRLLREKCPVLADKIEVRG